MAVNGQVTDAWEKYADLLSSPDTYRVHLIFIHQEIRGRELFLPEGEEWIDVWSIELTMKS